MAVAIYLMLVALAGPGLCCCTTMRLWAKCSHQRQPGHAENQAEPASHRGCCHHHSTGKSSPQPQPPHDSPACPCKEHRSIPVALLATDLDFANQFKPSQAFQGLMEMATSVPTAAMLSANGTAQLPGEGLSSPYLTPRDMLRALHILRC